jgi:hypothetical protein
MLTSTARSRAAALLLILGSGCISTPVALAQSELPGGAVVAVTSPPSGSRVGSTVTVAASVSRPVAGVQFLLDGVTLGAEDTTAPYAVSWDATTASDGWHTLSAIARDVTGLQYASDPVKVRVANAAPPPAAVQRFEETDPSVTYSSGWLRRDPDWFAWSGGGAVQSLVPGARATFAFRGTSVAWIGYRSGYSGIARVYVDEVLVAEVDLFARTNEASARVFTVNGLTDSDHTLAIEVTGRKNSEAVSSYVTIDAFEVPAPAVSHLQDTDPAIAYSTGWAGGNRSKTWSGGSATVTTVPGALATLEFSGTEIGWIGYRGPDGGMARVFLDGGLLAEVDTYSPSQRVQDTVFRATGLADASHTLTIEATGQKNAAATNTLIVVDAFDVTAPGTRFQETDWSVTYAGSWTRGNRNRTWSEGTAAVSGSAGARATFAFRGTAVRWIGFRAGRTGIARVYLDGMFAAEIDTYAPGEGYQDTIYSATGLADASHTLTVESTGLKNPASTSNYVVVDAFDVRP